MTKEYLERQFENYQDIVGTYVTPEMFGAKGDGVTDDTDAFTAAFAASPNIKCDGSKTYKFNRTVINDNTASNLDLCGATLVNFHIKVRIASDGYKSSDPNSSNFFKMHDGHLGVFTELPSDWQTPVIQCGTQLWLENLSFSNTPYIAALTNNYRDRMVFKNLLMINKGSLWTGITWTLDAINLITGNGTFARINAYDIAHVATDTLGFAGDGWIMDNIDEFKSSNQNDYFFIHTRNQHTLNINRCVQTRIAIGTNTHVEFSNCHFENANAMPVIETLTDSSTSAVSSLYQVDFDNCWFTDTYVIESDKPNVTYTNCYFRVCGSAIYPTTPFATVMGERDFYNVDCKIIDCVFDTDKDVINSETWKSYKAQPKRTRNSNNNTANEGTLAGNIDATKTIASGSYKYPETGSYSYVGYLFNNSTCNDDTNSNRIAHEKYTWTRTVSSVDSAMDGSTGILNLLGGWAFEIYRTLPSGIIQRARFYDSPIDNGVKNVTQKKFHIREYGNYLVINKTVIYGSTYTEIGYRLPWITVTSIPNYTVNAQVYEKNGVLVTLDGSAIPNLTNKAYAQVKDNYSEIPHYAIMPSTADLFALPNNTVFETDGFWEQKDGNGGKYIISTSALRGGLELTDGTNTRYLCLLDDYGNPANEVNVCKYGIREYAGNLYTDTITKENTFAIQNTYIITHIYLMKQLGTFKFPKGRFVFTDPLDLRARNITFEGACAPVLSHNADDKIANSSDSSPATILCFPFLQNGETAITTRHNISNLIVYGNFHTYDIVFDRTKTITAPDEVVTETITDNIQCTGIASTSTAVIQNVLVAGFYKGIERSTPASGYFFNISFVRCHYGINLGGDSKAIGVYGWDVHTLIRVAGAALQSVEQARVDNCVHMVELRGCKGVTLHDFDGDYCTDSMVLVDGDAEAVIATAFHARCCTLKSYDGSGGAAPIDVRDLADTSGYGIIRLANSRNLKNCHFSFNRIGGQNPFDTSSDYKTPETVLTMDNWARFEDCTFELPITADDSDYILSLFQTNANCKGRIDTSSGTYYIKGTSSSKEIVLDEIKAVLNNSNDFADFKAFFANL